MYKFDESRIITELNALPTALRIIFAASCAERQMHAYRLLWATIEQSAARTLQQLLEEIWAAPDVPNNPEHLERQIEEAMALIPQENKANAPWTQGHTNAQNAAMSVIYALRTKRTGDPQEAAWSARVAYEATDNFVINSERIDTNLPEQERYVLSHPIVQRELERQARDLSELREVSGRTVVSVATAFMARAKTEALAFFGA